jgi:hypothetical protein
MIKGALMPSALIADVRGSRQLDNWPEVFATITRTLTQTNKRFKDDLVVKFHPTVGDEFQGVLTRPEVAFEAYTFIKARLSPVRLYFGLGVGEVEKSGPGDTGLRGSAFYRARTALEECKKEKGLLRVCVSEEKMPVEKVLNTLLLLTETIELSWTKRQREILNYYRLNPQLIHDQLATHFQVDRSTITHILRDSYYKVIYKAESTLKAHLEYKNLE